MHFLLASEPSDSLHNRLERRSPAFHSADWIVSCKEGSCLDVDWYTMLSVKQATPPRGLLESFCLQLKSEMGSSIRLLESALSNDSFQIAGVTKK